MFCDNELCLFQKKSHCTLEKITIDDLGRCAQCVYMSPPESVLDIIKDRCLYSFLHSEDRPEGEEINFAQKEKENPSTSVQREKKTEEKPKSTKEAPQSTTSEAERKTPQDSKAPEGGEPTLKEENSQRTEKEEPQENNEEKKGKGTIYL